MLTIVLGSSSEWSGRFEAGTSVCDFRHSHRVLPVVSFEEHDVALQTRCLDTSNDLAGNARYGTWLVPATYGGSRKGHTALRYDERASCGSHGSLRALQCVLLSGLRHQADSGSDASGSTRQWRAGRFDTQRIGARCPDNCDKGGTARSACPSAWSIPPSRLLHFPDLVLSCPAAFSQTVVSEINQASLAFVEQEERALS